MVFERLWWNWTCAFHVKLLFDVRRFARLMLPFLIKFANRDKKIWFHLSTRIVRAKYVLEIWKFLTVQYSSQFHRSDGQESMHTFKIAYTCSLLFLSDRIAIVQMSSGWKRNFFLKKKWKKTASANAIIIRLVFRYWLVWLKHFVGAHSIAGEKKKIFRDYILNYVFVKYWEISIELRQYLLFSGALDLLHWAALIRTKNKFSITRIMKIISTGQIPNAISHKIMVMNQFTVRIMRNINNLVGSHMNLR